MNGERLPSDYCLWDLDDNSFEVGILGTGPGFRAMLDILFDPAIGEFLPPLHLCALSEPGVEKEKLNDPRIVSVPIFNTYKEMLAAHPEINLLIELAGQRYKARQIASSLPESVVFIDHTSSFFLCALSKFGTMSARCRTRLDSQQALIQAIVDEVPEDIILLDHMGLVVDCNRSVMQRSGESKQTLLRKPCWEVMALDENMPFCRPDSMSCPFHTALKTGKKAEALETRVGKDGRLRYFRVYAYPIYEASGSVGHVLVMRRDITSRTEEEKRAQQDEKMGVVGKMGQYLAHEIRNPLFAIGGFANSLLKSSHLDEREREKVHIILEETARLDRILKEILGFTKPSDIAPDRVNPAALAAEAVEAVRSSFTGTDVSLVFIPGKDLPLCQADADTLKRCLIHLVHNALEAIDGPGEVEVSAFMRDGWPILCVRDTGRGMNSQVLEKIFSPFFSTKGRGGGLGLAMIRKSLEDWGGTVEVTSLEGQGTTVCLKLAPVLAVDEASAQNN
ncbi:ATP-binding protein [Fundidesulfovibrio butyratiphilus]